MLNLRKGDDYLSDRMPIWFSNTRYYENKRIVDNALKSVVKIKVGEQNIKDCPGHIGHIELSQKVYFIHFLNYIKKNPN